MSPPKAKKPPTARKAPTNGRLREPTPFGALVRDLRIRAGISQAALAHLCGISPGYVGLIETGERGERPSLDIVKRFASALRASIEETELLLRAAGHLGEHERLIRQDRVTVLEAIDGDQRLTASQKAALIATYRAFLPDA